MPRGPHDPVWTVATDALLDYQQLKVVHRSDGDFTPQEDEVEQRFLREVVLESVVNAADCNAYGQAVTRYGPECQMAQRLMRDRAKRLGNLIYFPGCDGDDPSGPAASQKAA